MKRAIIVVLTLCMAAGSVMAQDRGGRRGGNDRLERRIVEMVDKYALDDEQALKMRDLYKVRSDAIRKAWAGFGRGGNNNADREAARSRGRAVMDDARQTFRMKFIPMLEPEQMKIFIDEITQDLRRREMGRLSILKTRLALEDEAWTALETKIKALINAKADVYGKLVLARLGLRGLINDKAEAKPVADKVTEIAGISTDGDKTVAEAEKALKAGVPAEQWAEIVLVGIVS